MLYYVSQNDTRYSRGTNTLCTKKGDKKMEHTLFSQILDHQDNGIIIMTTEREIVYVNHRVQKVLGDGVHQVFGKYLNCQWVHVESSCCASLYQCQKCVINKGIHYVLETKGSKKLHNVQIDKNNLELAVTMKISLLNEYILIELSEFQVINFKTEFLIRLADKSNDIMFFKDEELKYVYVNQTYANFYNKDKEYLIGKTDEELINAGLLSRELYEQCRIGDIEALKSGHYHDIEVMGDQYFRVSKENIENGVLGIARNITEEMSAIHQSEIDQLTGVYNRHKFEQYIRTIYDEQNRKYAIAVIDVDDLRGLNNEYGHLKGDTYLKALGKIFQEQRHTTFFRIGGDEFVGLINTDCIEPDKVFNSIVSSSLLLGFQPQLSISVGVSQFDTNLSYEQNYELADRLLYQAKSQGKNGVIINISD